MEDLLYSIGQKSGIYSFMHTSWGWPTVESLHFLGLSLLIGCIGLWDLRLLGVARGVPMDALHRLVPWGVGGYALNLCTGFLFVVSAPNQYLYNPAFQIKLSLMAIAGLNILVFYRFAFRPVRAAAAGGVRAAGRPGRGGDLPGLLGRRHRLRPADHLLPAALPLVLLVLKNWVRGSSDPPWGGARGISRRLLAGDLAGRVVFVDEAERRSIRGVAFLDGRPPFRLARRFGGRRADGAGELGFDLLDQLFRGLLLIESRRGEFRVDQGKQFVRRQVVEVL